MAVDRLGRPLRDDPYRGNVRVYAASNITLSGLQTIDGVTLESGDRVLCNGQTTTSQNGIHVASNGVWSRSRDLSTSNDFTGPIIVTVEEGTTYRNTFWHMLPASTITVGTDAISFTSGYPASLIGDDSITNAKLANMAGATFKMREAGAGTGAPIDGTAAQARTALGWLEIVFTPSMTQTAIQSAIDAAPPGSSIVFQPGDYEVTSALLLSGTSQDRTKLRYRGPGAVITLEGGVEDQNVAEITSGEGYDVQDIEFVGNKASVTPDGSDLSYRYFNGLYVGATAGKTLKDVRVSGCTFRDCAYSGLMAGSGPVELANILPGIDGLTVLGNKFIENEVGVSGGAQRSVTYVGNEFLDNDIYGILIDKDSTTFSITGNTIRNLSVDGAINACIFAYEATKGVISDNSCTGGKSGITVSTGADHVTVNGNAVDGATANGITVVNSDFFSVTTNTVTDAGEYGISVLTDATQGAIVGNVVDGCGFDGIAVNAGSNITISENVATRSNGSGIRAISSSGLLLKANICLNNNVNAGDAVSSGIRLSDTSNCVLIGNRCTDTQGTKTQCYGLLEAGTSSNNALIANKLSGNLTADLSLVGTTTTIMGAPGSQPYLRFEAGTAGVPTYSFAGDTDTGMFGKGSDILGFAAGGVQQFEVQPNASATDWVAVFGGTSTVSGSPLIVPRGATTTASLRVHSRGSGSTLQLQSGTGNLGFFGLAPGVAKQTVTGSRGSNAALQSLLTALAAYGLITDSSS